MSGVHPAPSLSQDKIPRFETRPVMTHVLAELRRDHVNMSKLLNILEHQLVVFDEAGTPDYDVLEGIVDYCSNYPRLHHHPLEDAVFRKLRERAPAAAEKIGDQASEHEILASLVEKFAEALRNVLLEAEIPRETFDHVTRELLTFYRHHIRQEEATFFPTAEHTLVAEDWADIESGFDKRDDPLFGEQTEERFDALRRHIVEWDREDQSP